MKRPLMLITVSIAFFCIGCGQKKEQRQTSITPPDPIVLKRAANDLATLKEAGYDSKLAPSFQLKPADMDVPTTLPFKDQVQRHAVILEKLTKALDDSQARMKVATEKKGEPAMFDQYLAAEQDERNTLKFLAPYAIAQGEAAARKADGFKLTAVGGAGEWKGTVCNGKGQCGAVDPVVALLMIVVSAVADGVKSELGKDQPFGPNNDLVKAVTAIVGFVNRPLGGPNSDLVKIRETLLAHDQNGEIAKMIRDPIKRPVEIVQDIRDKIIPPTDNGEIAKAVRDPIKCTVGHLWGAC